MDKKETAQEIYKYARDVKRGKVLACKYAVAACDRFLRDIQKSKTKAFPYRFDEFAAWRVIYFIEALPHVKGKWARKGEKLKLEPWQKFNIGQVFGWVHKETGLRRFRTVYIEVPRKNAKSTISAGVSLYMLGLDGEIGAEVYSAATRRDQARIVFDDARQMVSKTPPMARRFGIDAKAHVIMQVTTNSKFLPLSADVSGLDGLNIHCAIVDELHAHKSRALYDVLETATGSREQSLIWNITTSGSNRLGVCYELRNYLTKILEGIINDETFFGCIYSMDDEDDWLDPNTWKKANPNYGVSVFPEDLERKAKKAAATPTAQANFLTKHLNRWVNADSPWMDMLAWGLCKDESLKIEDCVHLPCWASLDLANRVDPAALVLTFIREEQLIVFPFFYMPHDTIMEKSTTSNSHFVGWVKEGFINAIPGPVIDQDVIQDDVREINEKYDVREVAFDPWQASQMMRELHVDGVNVVEVRPGVKNFSEPMKHLEALIKQQRIVHDGNPVMDWMMSNVVAHLNAKDEIYPRKEVKENKIDGVIGLLMDVNRILADEGPLPTPTISIYGA